MTATPLTRLDCEALLGCLDFAKKRVRDYPSYPSPSFRAERLADLDALANKVRSLRDEAKRKENK